MQELYELGPSVPARPQTIDAKPLAATPPASDTKLGRTQSLSLSRWQLVTSPITRNVDAKAATTKGASTSMLKR